MSETAEFCSYMSTTKGQLPTKDVLALFADLIYSKFCLGAFFECSFLFLICKEVNICSETLVGETSVGRGQTRIEMFMSP